MERRFQEKNFVLYRADTGTAHQQLNQTETTYEVSSVDIGQI